MPVYEFLCRDCDARFDDLVGINDVVTTTCPTCTSDDVAKLFSTFKVGAKAGVAIDGTGMAPQGCLPGDPTQRRSGCCGGGCGGCG